MRGEAARRPDPFELGVAMDGDPILQVDAYPLTVYSAAAVQELHDIVKQQRTQIAELSAQLQAIETLLAGADERPEGRQP